MDKFVQAIHQKLLIEIEATAELKKLGVKNPRQVGEKVRQSLEALKAYFTENPFMDENSEIIFFKYEKPAILSEYIYAQELYTIETNKPVGDLQLAEAYYTQELAYIRRFFGQYRYLYQYFQLDGNEFDRTYFLKGGTPADFMFPSAPGADDGFSAPGDFLYAKFNACERLQDYLASALIRPGTLDTPAGGRPLKWTGDVINLVELIYGLNLTGQLNYGNASLNEIVRWAENEFQVKIGVVQRRFAEIQGRKRLAATKFIGQMRDSVQQKIEELSA